MTKCSIACNAIVFKLIMLQNKIKMIFYLDYKGAFSDFGGDKFFKMLAKSAKLRKINSWNTHNRRAHANYFLSSGFIVHRGRWTTVSMTQQPEGKRYIYTVKVGNVKIASVINTQPKEFLNVKVYSSNRWHDAAQGCIKNLIIIPNTEGNDSTILSGWGEWVSEWVSEWVR